MQVYYIRENGYKTHKLIGPYESEAEAVANLPQDKLTGLTESWLTYWVVIPKKETQDAS